MNVTALKLSALAAAITVGLAGAASAQTTTTGTTAAPATTAGGANAPANNDRGFDWGWLGLIGLAGLAGLTRRDQTRTVGTTSSTVR